MSGARGKARSAVISVTESEAWGQVFGVGTFLVIVVFVPAWGEAFTMPKVIVLTALAFATIPLIWQRRSALRSNRAPLAIAAGFAFFALLSQMLSGAPQLISLWGEWTRRSGTVTAVALVLLFAAATLLTKREIRVALAWMVWGGLAATIYSAIQLAGLDPLRWSEEGWVASTFGNPNFAAGGLAMLALLTGGLALTRTFATVWRILMTPLAAAEVFLALQTGSQQAVFALAGGAGAVVVVLLLRWDDARRGAALAAVAVVGLVGAGLTVAALFGWGPLVPLASLDTLVFRRWYWGAALGMASAYPLLGVGPDGYGRFYGEFRSESAAEMLNVGSSAAHNVPLQWTATLGIPAGVLYVALVVGVAVIVVRRLWRQQSTASPLAIPFVAVWTAYQVQSVVSVDLPPLAMLGWLASGLLLAITSPARPDVSTTPLTWVAAGSLAALGAIAWWPAAAASNASKTVVQTTSEQNVLRAMELVHGTSLPCEASVTVGKWMIQVAPSEQTVNGVIAGAEADNRCYGLVNAAADFSTQLEQPEQALAFAQQGVTIDPLNYSQWILLAKAQHAAGDDQAAVSSLRTAIGLSPAAQAEVDKLVTELGLPPLS